MIDLIQSVLRLSGKKDLIHEGGKCMLTKNKTNKTKTGLCLRCR